MKELEKIKAAKDKLMSLVAEGNEKDAEEAIAELLSAQAQADIEEVELVVPSRSVTRKADLDSLALMETESGFLFQAKGGFSTFVDYRMRSVTEVLKSVLDGLENGYDDAPTQEEKELREAFCSAWLYVLQAPIFCSLDPALAADTATSIIKAFSAMCDKWMSEGLRPADGKADADFLLAAEAVTNE